MGTVSQMCVNVAFTDGQQLSHSPCASMSNVALEVIGSVIVSLICYKEQKIFFVTLMRRITVKVLFILPKV